MTLRLRLVLALIILLTAGLVGFGAVTYTLFDHSQYQRLDAQIKSSAPSIDKQLDDIAIRAGLIVDIPTRGSDGLPLPGPGGPGQQPRSASPGTYAELRSNTGAVLATLPAETSARPRLPAALPAGTAHGRLFNVGSTTGSGGFRVYAISGLPGTTAVIAAPLTEVTDALRRLVLIEAGSAASLLVLLSTGSWLVLRRGLRPLERMARKARSITAGDLSQRVGPSGGPSEVGQLGLALNTMLGDIETAFAEREATEARLRRFLADASHELRTPLTSIQGFAELFRVGGAEAVLDLPTILRRIEQEAARMSGLVDDLLLLAHLDQTREAERQPVDLAVLAADACSDAVAIAPERGVTLDAPEPVVVRGDQGHLRQAIANLVTNAVRHTPSGTPIEVTATLDGATARISVRDHGPGLDDDAVAHVFDRFWQADHARVGTGAGLGLAIVASIAAEHGGTATAANAPGGGAEFTVSLPVGGSKGRSGEVPAGTEPAPSRR